MLPALAGREETAGRFAARTEKGGFDYLRLLGRCIQPNPTKPFPNMLSVMGSGATLPTMLVMADPGISTTMVRTLSVSSTIVRH